MTNCVTRWNRRALPLWIICLFAPVASAQPTLWGTAAPNATFPNGRLLRIDYFSGTVQATFNGPAGVTIGDGFTGVAIRPSNGQVFITDGSGTNTVFRIDPSSGTVLSSFPSPTGGATIDGLEFLGDELYGSLLMNAAVVRINPDTGAQIGTTIPGVTAVGQGGLTIAFGALYSCGTTGNTLIARRDLTTGAVLSEFASPNNEAILGMAADGTSIFVASNAGIIYRLDPLTGAVLDSRNIGIGLDGLGGPAPIPEPSAGLLVLASVVVGFVRRRQFRSRVAAPQS